MSYESTGNKTVSGFDIQGPKPLPASAFGSVKQPAVRVITKTANELLINTHESGSYFFCVASASNGTIAADVPLSSTSCVGPVTEIFITTGSFGTEQLKLPIEATVWSGSGVVGNTGDVIFVYRGGL